MRGVFEFIKNVVKVIIVIDIGEVIIFNWDVIEFVVIGCFGWILFLIVML